MVSLVQLRHTIDLLSLLEKAEPKVKPEWAKKYKLEWNEQHHRWMKSDGSHGTEKLPKGHKFKIGEEYVIGPDTVSSKKHFRGTPIEILDLSEDGKMAYVYIRGEKAWVSAANLEKVIENEEDDTQVDPSADINPDLLSLDQGEPKGLSDTEYSQEGFKVAIQEAIKREQGIEQEISYVNMNETPTLTQYVAMFHHKINNSIRDGKPDNDAIELKSLMKPMGKKGVLYRGTGLQMSDLGMSNLTVGSKFQLKSFASTSRNPGFSWDWQAVNEEEYDIHDENEMQNITADDMTIFLELHHDETTTGISLSNNETGMNEWETILDYGQNFEIERIDWIPIGENPYEIPAETQRPVIVARFTNSLGLTNDFGFSKVKPLFAKQYGFEWDMKKQRWIQEVGV